MKAKRSGMRASTAHNWQVSFLNLISEAYSMGIHFHMSNERIQKRIQERVYDNPAWKKVPAYVHSYLSGWMKCKRDSLYSHHLVWTMSVDGELLTREEMSALYDKETSEGLTRSPDYKSPWARCNNELSRHVWTDKDGKVLKDKPF